MAQERRVVEPDVLQLTAAGLYCAAGDFYIDPWKPVTRAVITHAHSDHARWGSQRYLAHRDSAALLRMRLGADAALEFLEYGQTLSIGGATVSLHPAGHMLGSAQVRIEVRGQIAVVTGDYKLESDPTCPAWEPVACHLLVTESTFGLPIYRWPAIDQVFADIHAWWREAQVRDQCCVLYGYAIGKSQRLLAGLDASLGPIYTHGAVHRGCDAYRAAGVMLPETIPVAQTSANHRFAGAMVLAVPSAHGTPWMRRFGDTTTAMASGWMLIRGTRRRRALDRGFVLSDHVDWPGLMSAIKACDPQHVWVTHGNTAVVTRYLNQHGIPATPLITQFGGDEDAAEGDADAPL